ncbi:MAG: response regulator transcription factor [Chitinophagaceae bacterium]|nr:response regulator transcription factor [Chitinophagaceae bacterium]
MKVLIIEDEPLVAEDIAQTLLRNGYEIEGVCYKKETALKALESCKPEMVLLDINLNNTMSGIDIAGILQQQGLIPFVFITSYSDKQTLEQAIRTEPSGYIVKPFTQAGIISTIELAFYNFRQRNKQDYPELSLQKINQQLLSPVSEREFDLLLLIYDGKTNKDICDSLFISMNTVKKHINHIYLKLDTNSRSTTLKRLRELMIS